MVDMIRAAMKSPAVFCLCVAFLATSHPVRATDWPNWRGPNHDGISREASWSATWDGEPKVVWKANVGSGFSSVTVAGGKLYTQGLSGKKEVVHCLDAATGKELWTHSWASDFKPKYYEGGTSSTPTVDGASVHVLGLSAQFACLDAATGKPRWEKDLKEATGAEPGTWGFTGSPLVTTGGRVVVNVGTHGTALDGKTGKILWQSGKEEAGYATPVPFTHGGKLLLAIMGKEHVFAVDPDTGTAAWKHPWKTRYDVNAADPIISGNRMLVSSGYGHGAALLDFATTPPKVVWENEELRSQMNPAVLVDGSVYGFDGNADDKPSLVCLDFATGKVRWREALGYGSVLAAGKKLIILTEKGELVTAEATPDAFKPLARAQVIAGKCWTVPTLANGQLIVRNWKGELRCLSLGK